MTNLRSAIVIILLLVTLTPVALAVQIDFETLADFVTAPSDDTIVPDYVVGPTTVQIGSDTDGDTTTIEHPVRFEDRFGAPLSGELNAERPRAYTHLADPFWFDIDLTDPDPFDGVPEGTGGAWAMRPRESGDDGGNVDASGVDDSIVILISGALPTTFTGEIWDIDSNASGKDFPERFEVFAYTATGTQIGPTIVSPIGTAFDQAGSLSAKPWQFTVVDTGLKIARLVISRHPDHKFTSAPRGVGYDNFELSGGDIPEPAAGIPEPATLTLWALATLGILRRRRDSSRTPVSRATGTAAPRD